MPLTPAAVFLGAAKVGSCSDIALDITSSTGSGGRGWVAVGWLVNGTGPSGAPLPAANLTALRNYTEQWSADAPGLAERWSEWASASRDTRRSRQNLAACRSPFRAVKWYGSRVAAQRPCGSRRALARWRCRCCVASFIFVI